VTVGLLPECFPVYTIKVFGKPFVKCIASYLPSRTSSNLVLMQELKIRIMGAGTTLGTTGGFKLTVATGLDQKGKKRPSRCLQSPGARHNDLGFLISRYAMLLPGSWAQPAPSVVPLAKADDIPPCSRLTKRSMLRCRVPDSNMIKRSRGDTIK
jgi:hypothetical protein